MKASQNCVNLIERSEGFSATPYQNSGDVPTVGFGTTFYADGTAVTMNDSPIEHETAVALLLTKLNAEFCPQVSKMVTVPVNQNQADALIDFAYNMGCGSLQHSTLLELLNQGRYANAALQFPEWCHAAGRVLPGLVARRAAEMALFNTSINTTEV